MTRFLSLFESGRLGDFIWAKASKLFNWASGRKPKVNPALKRRLGELQQKYAKP